MKKFFIWKSVLYIGVALCAFAALIFFSDFFVANSSYLIEYRPLVWGMFAWTGLIGSALTCVWAVPYALRCIGGAITYYRYRW